MRSGSRRASTLRVYMDHKSPYAFLAKDLVYALEDELGIELDWRPYILDLPGKYAGVSTVDADGRVTIERSPQQWRRTRYEYMNCRREANLRRPPLTVLGPQKIWDSSLAAIGSLYAREAGRLRAYDDRVFERFFKRQLDIEDPDVIRAQLHEAGVDTAGFGAWLAGEGRRRLQRIQDEAEAAGVFGVPTFLFEDGDLYWGREHLPRIAELLRARADA